MKSANIGQFRTFPVLDYACSTEFNGNVENAVTFERKCAILTDIFLFQSGCTTLILRECSNAS